MYTVSHDTVYELVVKNSKFIALLYHIDNDQTVSKIIDNLKIKYPNATHYCFAYITDTSKKANDDGEPSGTAGIPILKVLENNNLVNVLCVVIRYFGGIKLGANGLIRAYTKCTANIVKEAFLIKLIDGLNIDITFGYDMVKKVDYLLGNIKIIDKIFDTEITYNIDIPRSFLNTIMDNNIKYKINKNIKIEENEIT